MQYNKVEELSKHSLKELIDYIELKNLNIEIPDYLYIKEQLIATIEREKIEND